METNANHVAVGSVVLLAIAGLVGFVLWLGKAEIDREFDAYNIYFTGSVSGLSVASQVRYRGVPVGTVNAIRIDQDNSEQVQVTIEVTKHTPIKEDAVASLEMRGITGLVDVQIGGGSKDSARLEAKAGEALPVIASTPSKLEELFEDVPNLLASATVLLDQALLLLSDNNLTAITASLDNVQSLTTDFAETAKDLKVLSGDLTATAASIRSTAGEVDTLVGNIGMRLPGLLDDVSFTLVAAESTLNTVGGTAEELSGEAEATLAQVREAAANLALTAEQLHLMVAENRPAFRDFSSEGLYELSRFMVEARALVASLSRVSDRFESDPARFMFGDSAEGYTPQ